ncbi:unnamed protein product [Bathycoccus prasinos]
MQKVCRRIAGCSFVVGFRRIRVQIEKVLKVPADADLKYPGVADLPGYDVQGKIWVTGTAHSRQRSGLVLNGKWNYGPKPIVKNLIRSTGYSLDKVHLVEGKVEDTLRSTHLPDKIAILRLDTDWYSSTKVELELLWDRWPFLAAEKQASLSQGHPLSCKYFKHSRRLSLIKMINGVKEVLVLLFNAFGHEYLF